MLTVYEAARKSGRNPETIRRWIRGGKLPARKFGTQHMIDDDDLGSLLRKRRIAPRPCSLPGTTSDKVSYVCCGSSASYFLPRFSNAGIVPSRTSTT
jgi:excisionase family DNA binding protein